MEDRARRSGRCALKGGCHTTVAREIGVAGLVGSGRTETARAIFGADPKIAGEIFVDGERVAISSPREVVRHGLCLMTEDRKGQGLLLGMSCAENITITDLRKISRHGVLERDVALPRNW